MLILTLLSVLTLIVFEVTAFVQNVVFDPSVYSEAITKQKVGDVVYDNLCDYFTSFEGPTGIPANVFIDGIDKDQLLDAAYSLTSDSIYYLTNSSAPAPQIKFDYSKVDKSVTDYIENYSQENGIEKDDDYYKLLENTLTTVHAQINSRLDVMLLYKLSTSNYAPKMHTYSQLVGRVMYSSLLVLILLVLLMIVVDRRHPRDLPYWFGVVIFCSSAILLAPSMYLDKIRYFDSFFMKTDYVYRTVTGLCNVILERVIYDQTVFLIFGIGLILLTIVIHMLYKRYLKGKQIHKETH